MFRRVLVANRGEIAVRIIRTLREMGITSVAAFSDADRDALFVLEADEAYRLGEAPASASYLNIEQILSVASEASVDAIHPGYGFLSENAEFAQRVVDAGVAFIGPSPDSIRLMGDKVRAREAVRALGVSIVPGTPAPVTRLEDALDFASSVGYPVAAKAAGGGGGRGIRVVSEPSEMDTALETARREAQAYFKNPDVYLERYFPSPRHVEIQVLGDCRSHLVHLGERDCSVQRRHQKLIEETPSPAVDRDLRARMGDMALRAAQAANYTSAGTVEFLLSREGEFYFLEMNTRIQVEHPITEEVTGVDLIREMILAAAGEAITVDHSHLDLRGHAIEVRVNAEDPLNGFRPTPALIEHLRDAGGPGIRTDSGVYAGWPIPADYDSLLEKVVVWAPNRDLARKRMLRALHEIIIEGPSTTIPFASAVLSHPVFIAGEAGTEFVQEHLLQLEETTKQHVPAGHAGAVAPGVKTRRGKGRDFEVEVNRRLLRVRVAPVESVEHGKRLDSSLISKQKRATADSKILLSPMHGTVTSIRKAPGDTVVDGETVLIIEAMKMENEVPSRREGHIVKVLVSVGETVEVDQQLATIE